MRWPLLSTMVAIAVSVAPGASLGASRKSHRHARPSYAARPIVRTIRARAVWAHTATLEAVIESRGARTTYRFVYRGAAQRTRRTSSVRVSAKRRSVRVHWLIRGLTSGTRYRFRVLAANRYGASSGAGRPFRTREPAAAAAPSPPAQTVNPVLANRPILWGAEIGTQFTGTKVPWDMTPVSDFQSVVGKGPSIIPFNIPFNQCDETCYWYSFPTQLMDSIRGYGAVPMINWSSMSSPLATTEPAFTLASVINGTYDDYIRSFALAAKAWGYPFFLRFNWEMNTNWFPWAEDANGNQSGQSAAAWRHMHDIFTSVGATNVNWVWCPSVTTTNATIDLSELYPGDAYVDWTCLDGFNWGTKLHGPDGWHSFSDIYGATYDEITTRIAPSKPMMIGEVASSGDGGSKAEWIAEMFNQLETKFTDIHALLWFDAPDSSADWEIEDSPSDVAAFRTGIRSASYQSNVFEGVGGGSVMSALAAR